MIFKVYRTWVSPIFHFVIKMISGNPNMGCKFEPTCSVYAEEAIRTHGLSKGGMKAFARLCRCHPFSGRGGFDPV